MKQAHDAVFLCDKSASRKSIKIAFNAAFDKLAYLDKVLTFENQKQQFCTFTSPEEMEIFIAEIVASQNTVIDLLDKNAKFTQVYRSFMPKKAQAFA